MIASFAALVLAASFLVIIGALALVTVMFAFGIFLGFLLSRRRQ